MMSVKSSAPFLISAQNYGRVTGHGQEIRRDGIRSLIRLRAQALMQRRWNCTFIICAKLIAYAHTSGDEPMIFMADKDMLLFRKAGMHYCPGLNDCNACCFD
jgi:hypothetical protein